MSEEQSVIRLEHVAKEFDGETVLHDVCLDIRHGEFLTILGPSGCGKTTLLRLLAGFESPSSGEIILDGRSMRDVPPDGRRVNTVFQSYALFPHMSVFDNVAFGLRMSGIPKVEIGERVAKALRMVGLAGQAGRRPTSLSGGQQQRVAIARAVVNRPLVLLLDEPLSALDYKLRVQMRTELKQLRREMGITFIFVTHDQEEAFSMSDRVVVMNEGCVAQVGTPVEVYEQPVNMFVARFVGETNVFEGVAGQSDGGILQALVEGRTCELSSHRGFQPGDRIRVLLRPEDLLVEREEPEDDDKLWLPGRIMETVYKGSTWDMVVQLDSGHEILVTEFFDEDADKMNFQAGERVVVSWFDGWEVVLPHEDDEPF
ncbi:spermidine/putrescine ABC transporter ATP-binding protein PotA [Paucidesulfovibrio gracilis]|nr:spermidine/putrescine ABC transporter ATP-binding protein PotA [Paucidesulfovibrio gracilis]